MATEAAKAPTKPKPTKPELEEIAVIARQLQREIRFSRERRTRGSRHRIEEIEAHLNEKLSAAGF